jgi:predicted dehydrogenase
MRVGVVGCGYWGSRHARVLQTVRGVERVVLIDTDHDRRAALVPLLSHSATFPSLEAALDDVDAVVVATPPSTHVKLALDALAAGKHVLVEKPMATSTADARRLLDAAARLPLTLMVGHTFEYNAAVRRLRGIVEEHGLGNLHYIDSARLNLGLYQADVNVVWDLAPHDVSIVNYLLRTTPSTVQAWASCHAHAGLEDVAFIRLLYPQLNLSANIHVSWLDPCKVRRVTVVGSQRMAVYNDLADEQRIRVYDKGVVAGTGDQDLAGVPMSYRCGDITSPYIDFQEPLMVQDSHFLDCIRSGARPLTDGHNGLAVVRILEAANLSLRTGAPVTIQGLGGVPGAGDVSVAAGNGHLPVRELVEPDGHAGRRTL